MKPSLFYGIAVSTYLGLLAGLVLHGPWESKAGGPQILFASAAAAELARPLNDRDIIDASAPADQPAATELASLDAYQLPAEPLPVTRLTRMGGPVRPADAQIERASIDADGPTDTLLTPINDFKPATADAEPATRSSSESLVTASYGPGAPGY
jgi:hypothetical protein